MRCEFRHPAVRDLAWVIGSAPLLQAGKDRVSDHWCRLAWLDRIPWLRELDNDPQELEQWLEKHQSHLLGIYFETLVEFWLRHWRQMEFIASRLQVSDGEHAIGEFDFLFRDRFTGVTWHWETAVKYFLCYRRGEGPLQWLGPNPRDTLPKKINKVFSHQLKVSSYPEAEPLLQGMQISRLQPQAYIKGWLFYHAGGHWQQPAEIPTDVSPRHLKGWWCQLSHMATIPDSGGRWVLLQRLRWLSPVWSDESLPGMGRDALYDMLTSHFSRSDKPLLLAQLSQGRDGIWREVDRGFVVADHWPAHRRHRR
jgi:hypothetical protein